MALSFVAFDQYDAYRTFFDGLGLVPRGDAVEVRDGGLSQRPAEAPPLLAMDAGEAARATRVAVDVATEEAVRPHEGAAVMLSGGLDSSVVSIAASIAWKKQGRDPGRLRFYHLLPEEGAGESRLAQAVAARLGHPYAELRPVPGDPFEGSEPFFALLDGPPDHLGPRTTLACGRRIVEEGATLLLTGDGGDEAFRTMPSSAVRELARSVLPDRILRTWRGWRRREPLPAFLADGAGTIESPRMRPEPRRGLRGSRALRDTALRCARNGVIAAWWRAFCESLGIEAGLPLLERRVVDLVVGVPEHTHRKAPRDRALERAAYADLLPEAVLVRPKDQPRVENAAAQAIRTYGGAWWERWVAGGAMERGGRLGAKQSREILARGSSGDVADVYRCLSLVNLEVWAGARGLDPGGRPAEGGRGSG